MTDHYTSNEFYADLLSYRLTTAKRHWDKVAFYVMAAAFVATWIALFWRREEVNGYINRFESAFVQWIFSEPYARVLFVGLTCLVFLLNVGPAVVHYIRKNWVYPKSSMHLQAYLSVQYKETVKLPRGRNSNTPRSHYVFVGHPVSGKVLPVEVSEDWYLRLEAGNKVHAHYHPSNDNVLYLTRS